MLSCGAAIAGCSASDIAENLRAWQWELAAGVAITVVGGWYVWRGFAWWLEESRKGKIPSWRDEDES